MSDVGLIEVHHALSLTQPWATLVALEAKKRETRSWYTGFRGWLAIHASKGFPKECQALCYEQPFARALTRAGYDTPADLPVGEVLAIVYVNECQATVAWTPATDSDEYAFGNYAPGRFSFGFDRVKRIRPFAARGMLGIWRLPRPITNADLDQVPEGARQ